MPLAHGRGPDLGPRLDGRPCPWANKTSARAKSTCSGGSGLNIKLLGQMALRDNCAEFRSFRRGCMALGSSEDNVWKQLSTTQIMQQSVLRLRCSYRKCLKNRTECSFFVGTVPPIFSPTMFNKHDEMVAFFT